MHNFLSFNGKIIKVSTVNIPAVSAAALYGRSIFTTIAIYNSKPFQWHLHEQRLRHAADKINLNLSKVNFGALHNSLLELIVANKIKIGRARLTLFDLDASQIWQSETKRNIDVLITSAEQRAAPQNNLRLTISPFRVNTASPLVAIKSCNYLENLLALETAKKNGSDEAVRLNERGEVVSATMANIFWTSGTTVFTPSPAAGALAGTTRDLVISLARQIGFKVVETIVSLDGLEKADEVFLTSAGLGVCSAKSLNKRIFESGLTQKLRTAFFAASNE